MVINLDIPTDFTVKSLENAVAGYPQKDLLRGTRCKIFQPGSATGILKGGNLVTLSALIDTEWEINTSGSVLFLEDVDELLHEVDRNLTHWLLAGKFKGVKALILGNFRGIKSQQIYDILSSQLTLDFPVLYCPYIGHVKNKITLPIGAEVELNTDKKQLLIKNMIFPGKKP